MKDNPDKLHIAIQVIPMAINTTSNPWGDFEKLVSISFRPPLEFLPVKWTPLYFKICKHNGQPTPITEEEFRNFCVESALNQSGLPYLAEV